MFICDAIGKITKHKHIFGLGRPIYGLYLKAYCIANLSDVRPC